MTISRTGLLHSAVLCSILLGSCASPPGPVPDSPPVQSIQSVQSVQADVPAVDSAAGKASSSVRIEPDSLVPESSGAVQGDMPASAAEISPVETPAEPQFPENPEDAPPLPPGERILYFYPEPQEIFVPPAPAPVIATPVKPAVPKSPAPAVTPAPVVAVVPKTAVAPPPAAKVETVPADKAAETAMPGIWESEITPVAAAEKIPPVPPSRKTTLAAGQTLEVLYPGSGWVYLGDSSAQNGLAYETRKLDKSDTLFTFKALKSGNYILDFSRFDLLEDAFSADSLAVEVSDSASKRTDRIRAPNYRGTAASSAAIGSASGSRLSTSTGQSASVIMSDEPALTTSGSSQGTPAVPAAGTGARAATMPVASAVDADAALAQAKKALGANDPVKALELLDGFFSAAVSALDEGWFLRGQAYEANGPVRDIRKALAAYETLVSAYPDSPRWKEADARIRYIKQFYLRIR